MLKRLPQLRQQRAREKGGPYSCLADFIAPKESGVADYLGGFAVTAGHEMAERVQKLKDHHDDYNAIILEALADRIAEAFAERMHERVRKEFWGYAADEDLSNSELIGERYVGIRPAAGYPACPDHTAKADLWELLDVEAHTGMKLTESFAMWPAASVSGLYFSHPQSRYFNVNMLGRDQIDDFARRKDLPVAEVERWLSHVLGFQPKAAA